MSDRRETIQEKALPDKPAALFYIENARKLFE